MRMSSKLWVSWGVFLSLFLCTTLLSEVKFIGAQPSPNLSNLPGFQFPSPGISIPKLPTQPFCTNEVAYPSCPPVTTFDLIDLRFFVGTWYEIGRTGRSKLRTEAGQNCQQVNYTLVNVGIIGESPTQLKVVNKVVQVTGPVATFGLKSIGSGTRRVCSAAKKICDLLGPTAQITQTSAQLGTLAASLALVHPVEAAALSNASSKIIANGQQIQASLDFLAKNVTTIQELAAHTSDNNTSRDFIVNDLQTSISAVRDIVTNISSLVSQVGDARTDILQVASSLLTPNPSRGIDAPPFELIGQLWKAAVELNTQEQEILAKTTKIRVSLANIDVSSGLLNLDQSNQTTVVSQVGSAVQNITSYGKLNVTFPNQSNMSKESPFWILALDGIPSQGYHSALTYSCTESANGDIKKTLSILSRNTTLAQTTLTGYLQTALAFGFSFDCEDPFILNNQDPSCAATLA